MREWKGKVEARVGALLFAEGCEGGVGEGVVCCVEVVVALCVLFFVIVSYCST